jgi:hypothetical protein
MNKQLGLSQLKSVAQYVSGDAEGALKTQDDFTSSFLFIAQSRSAVEWLRGDKDKAWETQKKYFWGLIDGVNWYPIVGHTKGVIHYVCGDRESGDRAMKTASHTTGVVLGGGIGMAFGGPVGAVAGGVIGGAVTDSITTGIDSAVHNEYRPAGTIGQATTLYNNPRDVGQWLDAGYTVFNDGNTGYEVGQADNQPRDTRQKAQPAKVKSTQKTEQPQENVTEEVAGRIAAGMLGAHYLKRENKKEEDDEEGNKKLKRK